MPRHPFLQSALLAILACSGGQVFAASLPSSAPPTSGDPLPGPAVDPDQPDLETWHRHFQWDPSETFAAEYPALALGAMTDLTQELRQVREIAAEFLAVQAEQVSAIRAKAGMGSKERKERLVQLEAAERGLQNELTVTGSLALSIAQSEILHRMDASRREMLAHEDGSLPMARALARRHTLLLEMYRLSMNVTGEWDAATLAQPWSQWRNEPIQDSAETVATRLGATPRAPGPVTISMIATADTTDAPDAPRPIAQVGMRIPQHRTVAQGRLTKVDLSQIMRFIADDWLSNQEASHGGDRKDVLGSGAADDALAQLAAAQVRAHIRAELDRVLHDDPEGTPVPAESKNIRAVGGGGGKAPSVSERLAQKREKQRLEAEKAAERLSQRKAEEARLAERNRIKQEKKDKIAAEKKEMRQKQEALRAEANRKAKEEKARLRAEAALRMEREAAQAAERQQALAEAEAKRLEAQRVRKAQEDARALAEREQLEREILAEAAAQQLKRAQQAAALVQQNKAKTVAKAPAKTADPSPRTEVAPRTPGLPPPGFAPLMTKAPKAEAARGESKRLPPAPEEHWETDMEKELVARFGDEIAEYFQGLLDSKLFSQKRKAQMVLQALASEKVKDALGALSLASKAE